MSISKSKNTKEPENTTKPKKSGDKITAVQWVKNSGHSLKGVFLEWLSEQQLFSIVGGEIKAIKKDIKKRKMSPKEKKSFKEKLADLSETAIAKFGQEYLGKDSPEETKEYVKEGLGTIMKQVKTGNFYVKDNLFGDDEEMEDFMDQLEDEWDDEDESPSSESFSYEDLVAKYKRGFGEFLSLKKKDNVIESKKIPGLKRKIKRFGKQYFQENLRKGEFKFQPDRDLSITYYLDKSNDDINDIQAAIRKDLFKDKALFEDIKSAMLVPDVAREYGATEVIGIIEISIHPDGKIEAVPRYLFKDGNKTTEGDGDELLVRDGKSTSGESVETVATELVTGNESYGENKKLYNLRKNTFD